MSNPLSPFITGAQNLYGGVTGALRGADLQGALSNPMFLYGASILGRGQTRAPQPLFDMQTFAQAQQMADMYKRRQFFSDLAEDQQEYEGQLDRFQDFATNVGEVARDYETEYTGTQEDILEEYTPDDTYEGVTAGFPLDPSDIDTAAYRERLLGEGVQLAPTGGSPEMVDAEIGVRGTVATLGEGASLPAALAVDPVSGEVMTPAPELMADPLSRENLTNRLLQSGVPALQQAGLQEKFKPPSLMAVDPWTRLYDQRTGKFVNMGGAGDAGGAGVFDPRLMSAGYKGALSEGIPPILPDGSPNPVFASRVRTLNEKTERTGPATIGTKLRELSTARDEGRITGEGYKNQVKQLLRNQWISNITESDKQIEKDVAKKFTNWQFQGGRFQDLADINQVEQVIQDFVNDRPITGNILTNRLPKFVQTKLNPNAVMSKDKILEITQRTLREILGAQFTEKEGELIMSRAWNENLPAKELAKRAQKMVAILRAKQNQLNEGYQYWRTEKIDIENLSYKPARSILGFEQQDFMTADDFLETLDLDQQSELSGTRVLL